MGEKIQVFIDGVKQVLEQEYPDLTGRQRYPVKAVVLRVYPAGAVDLQVLDREGGTDTATPPLPEVPLPEWLPVNKVKKGDHVRVGFYYHDPAQPFVEGKV